MKRYTKYAMALLASLVLALALTACGGGGGGGTSSGGSDSAGGGTDQQQQASFDNITFDIGDISVDIHGSEVVFNAQYEVDVLHLYGTITNNGDEPFNPYDLEVDGMQGTQLLRVAQTRDADGHFLIDQNKGEDLAPGASAEVVWGWELKWYDDPVVVTFSSYYAPEDETVVEFDVSGSETEDHAAIAPAADDADHTIADITGATVTLPNDSWYFESSSTASAKVKNDENGASVNVVYSSTSTSAQEDAETNHGNFSDAGDITTVEINGVEWVYFEPVPGSQFMIFAESPSGGVVQAYGMFASYDECMDLLEKIELK